MPSRKPFSRKERFRLRPKITAPHGPLGKLGNPQDFRLEEQSASAIISPAMNETETQFSFPPPSSMNPPGANRDLSTRRWPYVLAATAIASFLIAASRATDLPPAPGPVPAERLVIQYSSGTYRLLSRTPLLKVIPPSDALPATNRPLSGFWFEVQTPKQAGQIPAYHARPDQGLYGSSRPCARAPAGTLGNRPHRSVFTVLIPQVPGSNNLVLVSSSLGAAGNATAAQPLAHIPLAEQPK